MHSAAYVVVVFGRRLRRFLCSLRNSLAFSGPGYGSLNFQFICIEFTHVVAVVVVVLYINDASRSRRVLIADMETVVETTELSEASDDDDNDRNKQHDTHARRTQSSTRVCDHVRNYCFGQASRRRRRQRHTLTTNCINYSRRESGWRVNRRPRAAQQQPTHRRCNYSPCVRMHYPAEALYIQLNNSTPLKAHPEPIMRSGR